MEGDSHGKGEEGGAGTPKSQMPPQLLKCLLKLLKSLTSFLLAQGRGRERKGGSISGAPSECQVLCQACLQVSRFREASPHPAPSSFSSLTTQNTSFSPESARHWAWHIGASCQLVESSYVPFWVQWNVGEGERSEGTSLGAQC